MANKPKIGQWGIVVFVVFLTTVSIQGAPATKLIEGHEETAIGRIGEGATGFVTAKRVTRTAQDFSP